MIDYVYKHAYDGYMHGFNGESKKAVESFTKMYKAGLKNPSKAKYSMSDASIDANNDYNRTATCSELRSTYNHLKTQARMLFASAFNREFGKAEESFNNAYAKLYPRTHFARETILAERNMPQ